MEEMIESGGIMGCLDGIKVIDISRLYPGPFCTMILADNGAEVIAVEDKRFKSDNLFLKNLYRNKRHITINLKKPKGKEAFFRLVEGADVVVEGFRPGVADKLGVGYRDVSKINSQIIYCSISGYGQDGPFKLRAGHDVNYLSYAGVLDLIGVSHLPPSIPGIQIADVVGALYGVVGIVMALFARERTGHGQYIDVSMTDSVLSITALLLFFKNLTGENPRRADHLLSHKYACYNTYETKDGRAIALGALERRFWKEICIHFSCEEYISMQYDDDKREEIINFFREKFRQKTLDEWREELRGVDCCWSEVLHYEESLELPLFKERDMVIVEKNSEKGKEYTLGLPIKFSKTPGGIRTRAVDFGENTKEVLTELGFSPDEFGDII